MKKYRIEILHVIRQVEYYEVEADSPESAVEMIMATGSPLVTPTDVEVLHDEYGEPEAFDAEAEAETFADRQIGSEWGN